MRPQLLRLKDIISLTGLSRSCILSMAKEQTLNFPQPIRVGKRAVAWLAEDIDLWIAQQANKRGDT